MHLTIHADSNHSGARQPLFAIAQQWLLAPPESLVELILHVQCPQGKIPPGLNLEEPCTSKLEAVVHAVAQRAQRGRPCKVVRVGWLTPGEAEGVRQLAAEVGVGDVVTAVG